MADVVAIVADGIATGWNVFQGRSYTLVADVKATGSHFPIHQMKPCQLDWQKLVFHEKICSVIEKLSFLIEN